LELKAAVQKRRKEAAIDLLHAVGNSDIFLRHAIVCWLRVPSSWNFHIWTFEQVIVYKPMLQVASRSNQHPENPARSSLSRRFCGL